VKVRLIQYTEEEMRPSAGTSVMELPTHQVVRDYSQFNHKAVRATYTGTTPEGRQGFVELVRGRRVRPACTFELDSSINEMNQLIRVGDRGDLYIISSEKKAVFKFIPDRREARIFCK